MRVVFTGGAGLIGRWAIDELVGAGHDVVSVVRGAPQLQRGLRAAQEQIIADAGDPEVLGAACRGADGVVHMAAIPAPVGHTARELLAANALTTMTVLEAAGEAGIRGAVIASSVSALGMAWSEEFMSPLYLPVDEEHPLRPTEGYALSKEHDEATARMAARRWGMSVFALRFPFTQTEDQILERRAADDDASRRAMAKELWGYLDVRDAARAVRLSLEAAVASDEAGCTVLNVIADDVLSDRPLDELVAQWHPGLAVPPGQRGGYDVERARRIIGFSAEHRVTR